MIINQKTAVEAIAAGDAIVEGITTSDDGRFDEHAIIINNRYSRVDHVRLPTTIVAYHEACRALGLE